MLSLLLNFGTACRLTRKQTPHDFALFAPDCLTFHISEEYFREQSTTMGTQQYHTTISRCTHFNSVGSVNYVERAT